MGSAGLGIRRRAGLRRRPANVWTPAILLWMAACLVVPGIASAQTSGGWIGLQVQALTPESASARGFDSVHGVLVGSVVPEGPAEQGGLRAGDIITELDGRRIAWYEALVGLVRARGPGQTIDVVYHRAGREARTQVLLAKRKDATNRLASPAELEAAYQRAFAAYEARDFGGAATLVRAPAEAGHDNAMALLAYLHDSGQGVAQDHQEAHRLYRLAAERGNSWAQYILGLHYDGGVAGRADAVRAYYWLERAVRQNLQEAVAKRDAVWKALSTAQVAEAKLYLDYVPKAPTAEEIERLTGGQDVAAQPSPSVTKTAKAAAPSQAVGPPPDTVQETQRLLARLGYDPGPADGAMGPRTRDAIRAFQQDRGLASDGRASGSLLAQIKEAAKAVPNISAAAEPTNAVVTEESEALEDLSDF